MTSTAKELLDTVDIQFGSDNDFTSFDESSLSFSFEGSNISESNAGSHLILTKLTWKDGTSEMIAIEVNVKASLEDEV